MKLHRELTSRRSRHLAHRIRVWKQDGGAGFGPVEADETYVGGKTKCTSGSGKPAAESACKTLWGAGSISGFPR